MPPHHGPWCLVSSRDSQARIGERTLCFRQICACSFVACRTQLPPRGNEQEASRGLPSRGLASGPSRGAGGLPLLKAASRAPRGHLRLRGAQGAGTGPLVEPREAPGARPSSRPPPALPAERRGLARASSSSVWGASGGGPPGAPAWPAARSSAQSPEDPSDRALARGPRSRRMSSHQGPWYRKPRD